VVYNKLCDDKPVPILRSIFNLNFETKIERFDTHRVTLNIEYVLIHRHC